METNVSPPDFFSVQFHFSFFPALLWRRLQSNRTRGAATFVPGLEHTIAIFICLILIALGAPSALQKNSIIGWIIGGIGAIGFLAILVFNIYVQLEYPPSYDNFLAGIFFFFVVVGITAGVFVGAINHSLALCLWTSAGGFVAGYFVGILAGLALQYLGLIGVMLNVFAFPAIIGVVVVDIVLLFG